MQAWDDIQAHRWRVSSSPTKQPRPESSASHFRVDKWSLYRGTYARLLSIDCTSVSTSEPRRPAVATNVWHMSDIIGVHDGANSRCAAAHTQSSSPQQDSPSSGGCSSRWLQLLLPRRCCGVGPEARLHIRAASLEQKAALLDALRTAVSSRASPNRSPPAAAAPSPSPTVLVVPDPAPREAEAAAAGETSAAAETAAAAAEAAAAAPLAPLAARRSTAALAPVRLEERFGRLAARSASLPSKDGVEGWDVIPARAGEKTVAHTTSELQEWLRRERKNRLFNEANARAALRAGPSGHGAGPCIA